MSPPASPAAAKERALAEQQEQLLQSRTEADRKLDAVNARLRAVAERERELEQRQQQLMQQVGSRQGWRGEQCVEFGVCFAACLLVYTLRPAATEFAIQAAGV